MKPLYPLLGIVPVLNTPFTEDDTIDIPGLKRHVEAAIQAGVAGLLVPAMASEVLKLSPSERHAMVAAVLEQTAGRVPVLGGAGAADRSGRLAIVDDLLALNCDGILLQIPYLSDPQYYDDVAEVAARGPALIMLQDWDPGGYGLPVPLVCRLFEEIPSFRCLKIEVVPAGVKYTEILQATGGRLHVSGGWAVSQMIEGLERGVHAFMPTGMHDLYTAIDRLFRRGHVDQARDVFHELLPILSFSNQHLDISIHFFKRLMHRQGLYATPRVRPPILPFDQIHERIAERLIQRVFALSERVKAMPMAAR